MQIVTVCAPSLKVPSHVIAISEAENRQKVDNFKPVYLVTTNINEKKFVFFEQRWSRRGHNLKVKSLALKPASPRKCPVHGSRTALFFAVLKTGQGHD